MIDHLQPFIYVRSLGAVKSYEEIGGAVKSYAQIGLQTSEQMRSTSNRDVFLSCL